MIRIFLFLIVYLGALNCHAQLTPITVSIPMSDGKMLAGDLYLPNAIDTFPTILIMTPYGKFGYALNGLPLGIGTAIAQSNYAFLVVDWRCRFASLSACALGSDDGADGYDVVEWAATQPWCDGKIGMWGPSALGNIQFQTAKKQPTSLVCCVPEVAAPHTAYRKYYPGGSLTTERLQTLNILFPGVASPIVGNPYLNFIWDIAEASTMYPDSIAVPMLLVGGWYDGNIDQTIYMSDTLSTSSPIASQHKTLIGPWVHGGTGIAQVGTAIQGELNYPQAEGWNNDFAWEFFDFHLRGINNGWDNRKRYTYFQLGDNIWNTTASWPPMGTTKATYYLHSDNSLQTSLPASAIASKSLVYDPMDPSPTHGGKTLNLSMLQGPYDQTDSVESRNDNLIFTTPVLTQDIIVQGAIRITLFLSSDRVDTDIAVRLTEVYPTGESMLLSDQIQRMRFRNGYRISDTTFMNPGTIYEVPILLEDLATTFKAGNQLRLIITSSNYPRYNRNMNTGAEMYPNNNMDTLVNPIIATNTIYLNSLHASSIELPIGINTPLGIIDDATNLFFSLYPNPTTEKFTIIAQNKLTGHITISDMSGNIINTKAVAGAQRTIVNTSNFSNGVYLVQIRTADFFQSKKLIIIN